MEWLKKLVSGYTSASEFRERQNRFDIYGALAPFVSTACLETGSLKPGLLVCTISNEGLLYVAEGFCRGSLICAIHFMIRH